MNIFLYIIVAVVAWIIGVFGWSQIIGSIQNFSSRGPKMLFPLLLWLAIIGVTLFIVIKFLPERIISWAIGMGVSLVQVLASGRIH